MDGTARCISCFRAERRRGGDVVAVTMPGGGRRPAIPAELAAWRTLRRVKAGELGPPVAACAACAQPMFGVEGSLPPLARWEIPLAGGAIAVGPDGVVIGADDAEAEKRIEEHFREALVEKVPPAAMGFALVLLVMVGGIGAILGACECPTMAIAMAAGGAGMAGRKR